MDTAKTLTGKMLILMLAFAFLIPSFANLEKSKNILFETSIDENAPPMPELEDDGFLPEGKQPYIHIDKDKGHWVYVDNNLKIIITRHQGTHNSQKLTWFMSEIFSRGDNYFKAFVDDIAPLYMYPKSKPEKIAQDNNLIYAQNGDFFSHRVYHKERIGIIIRDKKVLFENSFSSPIVRTALPSLDELAFYEDGLMEVRYTGEANASDYLALGARDVLSFGPILIKDGLIDSRLMNDYRNLEPRTAIGMVEKGHYIGMLVEGRTNRSEGSNLYFLAEKMLESGCRIAINLDGGRTAAMIFMGENVALSGDYEGYTGTREQSDIIGIGTRASE